MADKEEKRTQWHALLGLMFADFLTGSPFEVDTEIDLSKMAQLLDLVIVRKNEGTFEERWPDGMEGHLRPHNLISFKSYHGTLDRDALVELISHCWNYRRVFAPGKENLLPAEDCQLFAISARYPRDLHEALPMEGVQPGVYDSHWGLLSIRIIVLSQLPPEQHNALLLLFSPTQEQVEYAQKHYHLRSLAFSTRLKELFDEYWEGLGMRYTIDDFARDFTRRHLKDLSVDDRLAGLSAEELRKRMSAEERVEGLSVEERVKGLPTEELLKSVPAEERVKDLSPDDQIKALSPEALEQLRQQLLPNPPSDSP